MLSRVDVQDGAAILAKYLEHNRETLTIAGCRALEMGAGTGLCGVALAVLGAKVSVDSTL
jgi:predicted nicotinamide N-methyase